jgi:hypothetical protein
MSGIPALVQILTIFALIVFATTKKVHLGLAAIAGGFMLALWRGMMVSQILTTTLAEVFSVDTILLLVLMTGIMVFSSAMKKSGAMDIFSQAIVGIAPSRRLAMAIAPLLIGTLPVPGGAMLSAPLVESMDLEKIRTTDTLSTANYWFRHTLEMVWPLYPAFILTVSMTSMATGKLILLNAFALPSLFLLGIFLILPSGKNTAVYESKNSKVLAPLSERLSAFVKGITPLMIVLAAYALIAIAWSSLSPSFKIPASVNTPIKRYMPIMAGLLLGCLYLGKTRGGTVPFRGSIKLSTFRLLAVIVGIRVFSAILGKAGVPHAAALELENAGIPTVIATALIPFIAGLVTGVGYGYVGLAYPIVFGMLGSKGAIPLEAAVVLAGSFGYAGMMLSPLHVCMVVTAEHFKVGLTAMIRRVALPLSIFIGIVLIYVSFLIRWFA